GGGRKREHLPDHPQPLARLPIAVHLVGLGLDHRIPAGGRVAQPVALWSAHRRHFIGAPGAVSTLRRCASWSSMGTCSRAPDRTSTTRAWPKRSRGWATRCTSSARTVTPTRSPSSTPSATGTTAGGGG